MEQKEDLGNVRPEMLKRISEDEWIATCEYCGQTFEGASDEKASMKLATHVNETHEQNVAVDPALTEE